MNNILTTLFITGCTLFTMAADPIAPNSQKEIIQQKICVAAAVLNENQKVEVLFTTDKDGKVNFALAKTSDPHLKQNIEKQFSALTIPGLNPDVVNSVTLNIKLI